ncbi:MAG: DUF4859 domain-containing protein [Bacteroides sp.]|nr:DUF4859 domain-containing protein [Bacteroides sp.]
MKRYIFSAFMAACLAVGFNSCKSDEDVFTGSYIEMADFEEIVLEGDVATEIIEFTSRSVWSIEADRKASWLTFTPEKGAGGIVSVTLNAKANSTGAERCVVLTLKALDQTRTFKVTQKPGDVIVLDPSEIKDYDKFFHNSDYGGERILRSDSKMSFCRSAQSEHFFVFWDPFFGDDPNGEEVPADARVDIDDLLQKAEQFFTTNIERLGMSVLGQGKSYLDQYKMQIYLLDPTPEWWVATGSGYDNTIGALWVTPATCHPVGSTIAHEIGHSFQYQTYCDKLYQGAEDDMLHGWRYGFIGPDGSGNGGCAYWEQCAQWQSFQDYPEEQFTSYNYLEWLNNCHRHFHHEFQRYASYWLQSYWVEKHGVEAYGRLWRESEYPEDAIMTYTRLYNGNDYNRTREELFDYAMKMATYDIDGIRQYSTGYQGRYNPVMVRNDRGEFQIAYENCPGATGFNVIPLDPVQGKVTVNFRGLGYGEALCEADKSNVENGDGAAIARATRYNACGGAENMGWRYGFVALSGDKRTYGTVGKDKEGSLSFDVPAGTEHLFLVVQGSPEVYMSHGWDEDETNDPQFPYAITLEGTTLANYDEPLAASYAMEGDILVGNLNLSVSAADEEWIAGTYDVADQAVADFFGMPVSAIAGALVQPIVGEKQTAQEGKIVVFNGQADGSLSDMPTANVGYWVDKDGNAVDWGNNQLVYYEINGSVFTLGKLGSDAGAAGESVTMRPVLVYTKNGEEKKVKLNITYNFK